MSHWPTQHCYWLDFSFDKSVLAIHFLWLSDIIFHSSLEPNNVITESFPCAKLTPSYHSGTETCFRHPVSDIQQRYMLILFRSWLKATMCYVKSEIMFGWCCIGLSRQGASLYIDCCSVLANVHAVIVCDEVLDLCSTSLVKYAMSLLTNVNLVKQELCLKKSWQRFILYYCECCNLWKFQTAFCVCYYSR